MTPDSELLADFARTNSEAAFAELVRRHVNLVYSAALRQVNGDAHLAQDVAQSVFTDLARKADSLSRRASLTGWLYTSAHFAAAKIVRGENRRRDREEKFMREPNATAPEADWEKLRPTLDDAMHELKEADRDAILLRYFENQPFIQVGAKLGLNENAARMRVERALEKLREIFLRRGVATTSALASAISANAVQLAPAHLAAALTAASLAATGTGTFTLMKILTMTKLKLAFSALVVTGAATAFVLQQQAQEKLRGDNAALQQQIAQLQTDNQSLSNQLAEIGDAKKLSDDQFNELLKLRGEIGLLRDKTKVLEQENQSLQAQFADASKSTVASDTNVEIHIKSWFFSVPKEMLAGAQNALGSQASSDKSFSGIMENENFTNFMAQISKNDAVKVLGEPEIITTSGRQAQMRATQIITVVTNVALEETNGMVSMNYESGQFETGPTLDVTPKILSDGHTIALPVIASVTDFLGYAPTTNSTPAFTKNGEQVDLPQVSPQFREQKKSDAPNLEDGQTLILKLPEDQTPSNAMLQSLTDANAKIRDGDTLVFVTATIVDSTGQRKY